MAVSQTELSPEARIVWDQVTQSKDKSITVTVDSGSVSNVANELTTIILDHHRAEFFWPSCIGNSIIFTRRKVN